MKINMKGKIRHLKVLFRNFKSIILVVFIALLVSVAVTQYIKTFPTYVSDNKPYCNEETNTAVNLNECNFCYYLDYSPSMFGFFADSGSNMYKLSELLEGITGENSIFGEDNPYICNQDILDNYAADDFVGFMRSAGGNYNEGDKAVNLSRIFTGRGSSGNYSDENAVNMIITDLNFFPDENGEDKHKKLINDFARQLASYSGQANICIYNLQSDFKGSMNTDKFDSLWESDGEIDINHSFFIIILSGNKFYDTFINELEDNMRNHSIDFSERKFELKNNMFNNHKISFDKSILTEEDKVSGVLQSLNLDNLSVGKIPDNALGLGLSYADDKTSSIKNLPVEKMELPGIYLNKNNKNKTSKIKTNIKVYYRSSPFAYKEYTGNDFITKQQAVIKLDDSAEDYWLYLSLDFNKHAKLPEVYGRKSLLADIRLQMEEPQFTIPQWVLSMNTGKLDNSWSKKVAIKQLFEKLISAKTDNYEQNTTEYQKWIGNFLIYMSY